MKYKVSSFKKTATNSVNTAVMLNDDHDMEISCFHVYEGATLSISFDNPNDFIKDVKVSYIVLKGQIEVIEENDNMIVNEGEIFIIYPKHNFIILAKEESDIICISNDGGGDFDNKHINLSDILREAERNDVYVAGHNYRVSRYSLMIMQLIDPSDNNETMRMAAGFHDIGKARLNPKILNKPGRLTDEEYEHVKKHSLYSYEILREFLDEEVAFIAKCHHEKLDGSGYPDGLKGNEIPIQSQVIAVADIFDALTTARSYREPMTFKEALETMEGDVTTGKINAQAFNSLKQLIERKTIIEGRDNNLKGSI